MTKEAERLLEKWRKRAGRFRQAYREAEGEVVNLKLELALKTEALEGRIVQLEAKLN